MTQKFNYTSKNAAVPRQDCLCWKRHLMIMWFLNLFMREYFTSAFAWFRWTFNIAQLEKRQRHLQLQIIFTGSRKKGPDDESSEECTKRHILSVRCLRDLKKNRKTLALLHPAALGWKRRSVPPSEHRLKRVRPSM